MSPKWLRRTGSKQNETAPRARYSIDCFLPLVSCSSSTEELLHPPPIPPPPTTAGGERPDRGPRPAPLLPLPSRRPRRGSTTAGRGMGGRDD